MPDFSLEQQHRQQGKRFVIGIDEAGRGPLAGPVCAAAVYLPPSFSHPLLNDSKKLTEKRRETIYKELTEETEGIHWGISLIDPATIDQINILKATHLAMAEAVKALELKLKQLKEKTQVDLCLIDGLPVPNFPYPSEGIVKGDGKSLSIAAASVLAKVTRDQKMIAYAEKYPEYGFEKHKGYGTKAHLKALKNYGVTPIHRQTFQPIAQLTMPLD